MSRSKRDAVTLLEVLVVIAIIGILIGLCLPAVRRVREPAARAKCQNNLKQLIEAFHSFEANSGRPVSHPSTSNPGASTERHFPTGCLGAGTTAEERLSWMVALLPYLEQSSLYEQFDINKGYAGNLKAAGTTIKVFFCTAGQETTPGSAVTHYVAMSGLGRDAAGRPAGAAGNGFMGYERLTSFEMIKDGTMNTIALMETRVGLGPWARGGASNLRGFDPANVSLYGNGLPFGAHDKVTFAAMADGSVRYVSKSIDPNRLAAAITIAGAEPPVDLD